MKGELCGQRENARAMRTVEIDEESRTKKRTIAVDEGFCAKGELLRRRGLRARYDLPIDCCAFATLSTIE